MRLPRWLPGPRQWSRVPWLVSVGFLLASSGCAVFSGCRLMPCPKPGHHDTRCFHRVNLHAFWPDGGGILGTVEYEDVLAAARHGTPLVLFGAAGERTYLTDGHEDRDPALSPDGGYLAFERARRPRSSREWRLYRDTERAPWAASPGRGYEFPEQHLRTAIYTMRLKDGSVERLDGGRVRLFMGRPMWCAGNRLALQAFWGSRERRRNGLWLSTQLEAGGEEAFVDAPTDMLVVGAAISPHRDQIAVITVSESLPGRNRYVYVFDLSTMAWRHIATIGGGFSGRPQWLEASGQPLVLRQLLGPKCTFIWVYPRDARMDTVRIPALDGWVVLEAEWTPQGDTVALVASPAIENSEQTLLVWHRRGQQLETLATGCFGDLVWSDDGKRLGFVRNGCSIRVQDVGLHP